MKLTRLAFIIIISMVCLQAPTPNLSAEEQRILELDINRVSRLALNNNFDIQLYRLDKSISEKELLKAQAVYDTELDASYHYDEDRLKRSSIILGKKETAVTQDLSLSKKLPTGTVLSLGASHQREATDSSFASLNPYHESEASISITQPLAKNVLGILDRNIIKITRLDIENTAYTSMDKIEQELAEAQKAYWSLLLANQQLDLTKEILDSANDLYQANSKNFDIGLVEPPEFYAVEANLKEKQKDVLLAENGLNSALNLIRFKLNLEKEIMVKPQDSFGDEPITADFDDIIRQALGARRDYRAAKNTVKAMDLYIEMKKNSLWPQIDLTGTLKKNGLDKKFRKSITEISSEDYPEYTVGVNFRFPLENSAARAEYSQKELEKAKALVNLKKLECLILVQTHDAFIHAKSIYGSVGLLKQVMELQHKKYIGEEDRFKKGRSDTDRLIRYQNDYFNAKSAYLKSLYEYQAALIDLRMAMNRLLQEEQG